jgi:hypothetical protein
LIGGFVIRVGRSHSGCFLRWNGDFTLSDGCGYVVEAHQLRKAAAHAVSGLILGLLAGEFLQPL